MASIQKTATGWRAQVAVKGKRDSRTFGADVYYIVTGKRCANELEINEQAVLKAFREMSQEGQDGILRMLVGADDFDSLEAFVASPQQGEESGSAASVSNVSGKAQVIVGGSNNVQVGKARVKAPRGKNSK